MKILAGIYSRDAGTIRFKGQDVQIPHPRAALDLGISMIHQELILTPHLTVAQNIFLGREPRRRMSFVVDDRAQVRQAAELIDRLHLRLDPRAKVADLKVAQQQMVAIAQALSVDASVLIMDEPTAALGPAETAQVRDLVAQLKSEGIGIFLISHDIHDVFDLADRISVMLQGKLVGTVDKNTVTKDEVLAMIIMGKQPGEVTQTELAELHS
jgi:ABC-type sugar transport system ATPase subunit